MSFSFSFLFVFVSNRKVSFGCRNKIQNKSLSVHASGILRSNDDILFMN